MYIKTIYIKPIKILLRRGCKYYFKKNIYIHFKSKYIFYIILNVVFVIYSWFLAQYFSNRQCPTFGKQISDVKTL